MRTLYWEANSLKIIDQRGLPGSLEFISLHNCHEVSDAIRNMAVRGAPAIGAAAAFGLAMAAFESRAQSFTAFLQDLETAIRILKEARPTAVNLSWALERQLQVVRDALGEKNLDQVRALVLKEAQQISDEDVETNKLIGQLGAVLIEDGDTIIHHCNTGSLAVVEWGTALGVIRTAHEQGKRVHVLVDETRPRLQGARLTAWELQQYGIPFEIISDSMAGYFLSTGKAQKVLFGADRIAANGDVANKIGTYMLALAAQDNDIPVYAVAPFSTFDLLLPDGSGIPIEQRDPDEVLGIQFHGERVVPTGAKALNPAFDITPNRLITAFVTERGIIRPPFYESLQSMIA